MKKIFASAAVILTSAISLNAVAGGNVAAGKALVDKFQCASCHGQDFKSPIDPAYPKLAGQHDDYLEHALIAYRRGGDGPNGRANAIMGPQVNRPGNGGKVEPLSDQDIKDISTYLHSLPGTLVVHK